MSIEALVSVTYGDRPSGTKQLGAVDVLRVLMVFAEYSGPDGAGACPAQRTIAEALGLERRDVRHAITALIDQGRIVKTADAIRSKRGDTYTVVCSSNDELGRAIPALLTDDDKGGLSPPDQIALRAGNKGGQQGRATRAGSARPEPEPEPENPPTPLSEHGATAAGEPAVADLLAALTDQDVLAIGNPRLREAAAVAKARADGKTVVRLFETVDEAAAPLAEGERPHEGTARRMNGRWVYGR